MRHHNSQKLAVLGGIVLSTRLFIGAVHVLFLMQRGLSLQDLAWIQIICSATILIVSYPIGLLADLKGSKVCVLLALLCYIIYYPCCLLAPNMIAISLGSIFYSIGLTTFQTTFQSWLVQTTRNEFPDQPQKIDHYTHINAEYSALGNMIFAPLGAIFAASVHLGYETLYYFSVFMMIVLILLFNKIPSIKTSANDSQNISLSIKNTLNFCLKSYSAKYFLFYSILYATVFQLVYHFWQPLFVNLNKKQLFSTPIITGIIFFLISLGQYLSNLYVRHIFKKRTIYWEISLLFTFLAFLFFLAVGNLNHLFKVGLAYILIHPCLTIGEAIADHQIMKTFPSSNFASLYSLKGVIGRIGAILSLSGIRWLLKAYSVQELYTFFSILVILILLPLYALRLHLKKNHENIFNNKPMCP